MNTATLSGWGQPHDALAHIAPGAVEYARHTNVADALASIPASDTLIGWSLGGQLAVRAVATGLLKPSRLILIATPFQFVATPENPLGMKRDLFDKFRDNYARNPLRTLHKSGELILKGDRKDLRAHLDAQNKDAIAAYDWLNWLTLLDGFTCENLNFSDFPPTLLIHGDNDAVVAHHQSETLARHIPNVTLKTLQGCGHAPHWHAPDQLRQWIADV
jgi:pimeloyl-[acyl-carrier protein] methyl ester esterase